MNIVKTDRYELYNDDCINVMSQLEDNYVTLVLCDLPYGSTPLEWDSVINFDLLWKLYYKICKPNAAIVLFGNEPFSSYLRLSNIKHYQYDWYWEKERLTNVFQVKKRCGKTVENISVFYKKQPIYNPQKTKHEGKLVTNKVGENARFSRTQDNVNKVKPVEYIDNGTRHPTQVLKVNRDNMRKRLHPTQKPVELLEYLIKTYSNEGDLILDNCMGSRKYRCCLYEYK